MDLTLLDNNAALLGRVLIGFYFLFFVFWNTCHRQDALACMRQQKIPFAPMFLASGIILEGCAGLLIIFAQYTAIAASLLIIFTLGATLMFHRFWTMPAGPLRTLNTIIFINNLTVTVGGLLLLVPF